MAVKFWWPTSMPAQVVLVQNFLAKIPNYAETLGMTEQQVSNAQDLCNGFIDAFNGAEQCRATMLAMTQWRDNIFFGEPAGEGAPPAPVFPVVSVGDATLGTVKQFFQLRDRITVSPGYTSAIGEDLGIVGSQITPVPPARCDAESESHGFGRILGQSHGLNAGHGRSSRRICSE